MPFLCSAVAAYCSLWHAQKGNGLQVLGLSIDKQEGAAPAYVKSKVDSFRRLE